MKPPFAQRICCNCNTPVGGAVQQEGALHSAPVDKAADGDRNSET
jgi:hypothetical protein